MSQPVHNESTDGGDDLKKPKSFKQKNNDIIMAPDGTQLQSIADLQQPTDVDEPYKNV